MVERDTTTLDASAADGTPRPPRDRPYVLVFDLDRSWKVSLPSDGKLVIGRGEGADLRLEDASVSRRHAELVMRGGACTLLDLGSHNGVSLNGERVEQAVPVAPRDIIVLGRATMVFHGPSRSPALPVDVVAVPAPTRFSVDGRAVLVADPAMARLYALLERLAPSDLPVLIGGETGTGKEIAAHAIHERSRRAGAPFVALNCASLPEQLAESELFGYERGAFSGAAVAKPGLLESAAGGTVFLDEIGDLPPPIQAKLLRVVETRRVTRLGGLKEREIDMRIVAATHRDLEEDVRAGRFRQDLFFRLSAATVWIPPLRDRTGELFLLAEQFLAEATARADRNPLRFSAEAIAVLRSHPWPGNVRELKNVVDYAVASAPGPRIEAEHLPTALLRAGPTPAPVAAAPAPPAPGGVEDELRALERQRMIEALAAAGGNQSRAAAAIGMPRRTFVAKLRQYGIRRPRDVPTS